MLRCTIAATFAFLSSPASALYNQPKKREKFGAGCIGAVTTVAPKLGTCTIAGDTMRIWCPNGAMFEGAKAQSQALIRSTCNLTQVP